MNADIRWLDDPRVFRVGKLPACSDHLFYRTTEEMTSGKSSFVQSLDGNWKFHYSENALVRPEKFYEETFSIADFDEIKVPGHIEMAGYDRIHYINTMYPWEGHYYRRPAFVLSKNQAGEGMFSEASYNPVGSYVKEFDLEDGLKGESVKVRFEGVEQAMYVWINGVFLGYSEDSFTPAEFDLTPYIKEKGNRLAVEVHKRSTAAFLEDQDFFRFFGIFRSVKLVAMPKAHVEDLWAKPVLEKDGSGSLSVELKLSKPAKVEASLCHGEEMLVSREYTVEEMKALETEDSELLEKRNGRNITLEIGQGLSITPWDHKNPELYQLLLKVYDENDILTEIVPYEIGFRRIEIKDKVIYLNGKRLLILGVNRHEWNARSGRCITEQDMAEDMKIFLANNINAVRTCHYPDQIPWYYMCDRSGIYMMAETNLETHGSWQKIGGVDASWNVPGSIPEWKDVVVDRAANNFERFKNHTSVLFWSLGNESFAGDDIVAMNTFFKERDESRLVHYEGVVWNREYEDVISDIESRMYAKPQDIREYMENDPKKPFLLCEYMHDMGNSIGGMGSYMKLFDDYEGYHGGFIWDYMDQAILVKDEVTGKEVMRYGGDFDDKPSDYDFSGNGIVFADRSEKPAMQEVKYYYGLYE